MKKSRLTKILVEGSPLLLKRMADQVEESISVKIERSPRTSLVMMKTRDSVSMQPFYMGEVLVTECTVEINNQYGIGVIMGEEPERTYQIAVVDAAFNAGLPMIHRWLSELEEEERKIQKKQRIESAMASQSKVNFDTMEDYNDKI